MPFAPGCPLSPFNEYASVSKSGEKHRVVYSNQLVIADSWVDLSLCSISVPLTASDRSSVLTSCWMVLCRAALSCADPCPAPGPAAPRVIPLSECVRVDPEELLSMYDESSGSMMLMPEAADKWLVLAEVVPVMASRASTRFLRRFTSSPEGWWTPLSVRPMRVNMLLEVHVWLYSLTQSNESEEEAEEEEQAEQEAKQPLPPAAAGAEAKAEAWFIFMDLWETKPFFCQACIFFSQDSRKTELDALQEV